MAYGAKYRSIFDTPYMDLSFCITIQIYSTDWSKGTIPGNPSNIIETTYEEGEEPILEIPIGYLSICYSLLDSRVEDILLDDDHAAAIFYWEIMGKSVVSAAVPLATLVGA